MVIIGKAHCKWKILDEACLLLHKIEMVQWLYHFVVHPAPTDPLTPIGSRIEGVLFNGILPNYKAIVIHRIVRYSTRGIRLHQCCR